MRIRTVKPEFWQDEDLAEISETARLVAIGLLNIADDEGFFNANEKLISSQLFPLTEPSVSIHECFKELSEVGYVSVYECKKGKKVYGHVVNFLKHQKVNRPSASKIKDLVNFEAEIMRHHKQLNDDSVSDHVAITGGKEQGTGNREQGTGIKEEEVGSSAKADGKPSSADKFTDEDLAFSKWFYEGLITINPEHKKPNFKSKGWADSVRLMREQDKRTHQQMSELAQWALRDKFWKGVVHTPAKLRLQWDKMTVQKNQSSGGAVRQDVNNIDHSIPEDYKF